MLCTYVYIRVHGTLLRNLRLDIRGVVILSGDRKGERTSRHGKEIRPHWENPR